VFVVHFLEKENDFPFVQKVRTGSWSHLASYSVSTGGSFSGKSGWSVNFNTHLPTVPNLRMLGAIHPLLHKSSCIRTNIEAHSLHESGLQHRWMCSCSLWWWWGASYFMLHNKTKYCTCVKCIYDTLFATDMFQPLSRSSKTPPPLIWHTSIENTRCNIHYIKQYTQPILRNWILSYFNRVNKLTFHKYVGSLRHAFHSEWLTYAL
jgi:hypothetical protein